MKILVIGGTGTMGSQLVDLLLQSDENVVYVVSRHRALPGKNSIYYCGNAFDPEFMQRVLQTHYDAIVDFMVYSPNAFKSIIPMLLEATDQYVSLSSSAVIANSPNPLDENSPRFLDIVPKDEITSEYHFMKAETEDILKASSKRNWTIVRPHVTFGDKRIPLCTYEMDLWLYRAIRGLKIAIPEDILKNLTTLSYGRETAWQISQLIGKKNALGEIFQVGSSEVHTWGSVVEECKAVLEEKGFQFNAVLVDSRRMMKHIPYMTSNFKCNRYFDRSFSLAKLHSVIGESSSGFGTLHENLSCCIDAAIPDYKAMRIDESKAVLYSGHDKVLKCWTPLSCFTVRGAYYYFMLRIGFSMGAAQFPFRIFGKAKSLVRRLLGLCGVWRRLTRFRANLSYACRIMKCKHHYARVLKRIQAKSADEKIKVLFVVCEIAKFKCGKLFEEMRDSGWFDPVIALSAWNEQSLLSDDQLEEEFLRAENFFDGLGYRHIRTVKTHPRICSDLSEFNPDIVFYSEPWGPCGRQDSESVSRFALTCFVPYYVPNYGNFEVESQQPVHKFLYRYFTLPFWADYFKDKSKWWDHASKFVPSGHPALDFFSRQKDYVPTKNYIVFAPHHSIKHPRSTMPWFLSTFDWTGRPILEYAKKHPEQHWVFKPHPILRKEVVVAGMMTKEEVDAYYAEWEKIGTVCYDSDYQELFLESSVIITDSGSFMTEAGATGRPVVRLISPANELTPLPPSKKIYDTYYEVRTLDDMYRIFKSVIEDGLDPKREKRHKAIEESGIWNADASQYIVAYLRKLLKR